MPNLTASQFIRNSAVPIGGVVYVHSNYKTSLLTEGSFEYLRSGEYVPYQAKYAQAATKGLKISGYGGNAFPSGSGRSSMSGSSASTTPEYIETFAKGKYGRLSKINIDRLSPQTSASGTGFVFGGGEVYTFSSLDGTIGTDSNPVILKTPDYLNLINVAPPVSWVAYLTRTVSVPFYLHHLNTWGILVLETRGFDSDSNVPVYLYTSKNGVDWVKSPGVVYSSSNFTNGGSIWGAGSAEGLILWIKHANGTGTICQYNRVLADGTVESSNISYTGINKATATPVVCAAISTDLVYLIDTDSSGTIMYLIRGGTNTGVANTPYTPGNCIAFAGNGTSFLILAQQTSVAANNFIFVADVNAAPSTVTVTTIATNNDTGAVYPYACWTGSYYLLSYSKGVSPNNNYLAKVASSGTYTEFSLGSSYTTTYSLGSNNISVGALYKNHLYIGRTGAGSRILDLVSGTESATLPVSDVAGYKYTLGYYTDFCYSGTNVVAASAAGLSTFDSGYAAADLRYWDSSTTGPLTSTDLSKGRVLKVLNGVIFVTGAGNTTNVLLYSTNNGASWQTTTITQLANIRDVEYDSTTGRYIVVGGFNTANVVYGTTIGTWTAVNASSGVSFNKIFKAGTSYIAYTTANTVRRTTDAGATWTASNPVGLTATGLTSVASVSYGTTTHVFHSSGSTTSGICTRYTSTDNGTNWSPTSINIEVPNTVPHEFVQLGSTWYCKLGYTNTGYVTGVYSTTDFTTFTQIIATYPYLRGSGSFGGRPGNLLLYNNKVVFVTGQNYTNNTPIVVYVVDSLDSASYIGTLEEITTSGAHGYVRIK